MLRKVADGGMAEIYLARQTGEEGFARLVIVKRILPDISADPHFRNMLVDEAHIAMTLNHSNVVPVLDLGRSEGNYFLVMELVDGWDLAAVYERGRDAGFPLPLGLALYVMAEVCRGLSYAHSQKDAEGKPLGIVHRDVSPQNVLLSEHGEVKVTDFGIAKALGKREHTKTGIIKGKLDFMSPEQASGAPLDGASDIFAAGTNLYFLATGRRPFASPSDFEALLRVQRAEFPPPEQARPGLSPAVVRIIKRAMAAQPAERYRSAEEMMLEIEAVLRQDFGSPGQSQLKRWLAELAERDGALPVSRRPGLAAAQSLESRWFAEGEMLSFEDSTNASARLGGATALRSRTSAHATGAGESSEAPAPDLGSSASLPAAPVALAATPAHDAGHRRPPSPHRGMPVRRPHPRQRSTPVPLPPPRRGFLRGTVVLLLLVAGAALAADQMLTREQQRALVGQARALLNRGIDELGAVIQRAGAPRAPSAPEALAGERIGGEMAGRARSGARASLPSGEVPDPEARAGGRQRNERGTVHLLSDPPGAEVVGPQGPVGTTPVELSARIGKSLTLTLRKPGHTPVTRRITVEAESSTITVPLPPATTSSATP